MAIFLTTPLAHHLYPKWSQIEDVLRAEQGLDLVWAPSWRGLQTVDSLKDLIPPVEAPKMAMLEMPGGNDANWSFLTGIKRFFLWHA